MEWISTGEGRPAKGINVLAVVDGSDRLEVMAYCKMVNSGKTYYAWCTCYGDINGDAFYDDDYKVIKWMYLPKV